MSTDEIPVLISEGRYREALEKLDLNGPVLGIGAGISRVFLNFKLNDVESTLDSARALFELDRSRLVESWGHCGLVLRYNGRSAEAFGYFQRVIEGSKDRLGELPAWIFSESCGALEDIGKSSEALEFAAAHRSHAAVMALTEGRLLIRAGDTQAACTALGGVIARGPLEERLRAILFEIITELFAKDGGPATRHVIAKIQAAFPADELPAKLGADLAHAHGDWATALRLNTEAARSRGPHRSAALGAIVGLCRSHPELPRDHVELFVQTLREESTTVIPIYHAIDYLELAMSRSDAEGYLGGVLASAPRILPALTVEMAKWGRLDFVRANCASQIDIWHRSSPCQEANAFIEAMGNFRDVDAGLLKKVRALHPLTWQAVYLLRQPPLQTVWLRASHAEDQALVEALGLDVSALTSWFKQLNSDNVPLYDDYLDKADIRSAIAREFIRKEERHVSFQDRIVRDRAVTCPDPYSGKSRELFDSVKIHDRQVFSFAGDELCTLVSGGNMNAAAFLHLVARNLILRVDSPEAPCSQNYYRTEFHMAILMAVYSQRAAQNYDRYLAAHKDAPAFAGTQRDIVAVFGRAENPAHHSWNYFSAFERMNLGGLLGQITAAVPPPTHYFGALPTIYPELGAVELIELPERPAIDPVPFSPGHVVLQMGGNFIPTGLKTRLQQWAARETPINERTRIDELCEKHYPIIWLGLRIGDKQWAEQEDGMIALINRVADRYPAALFILDSFSLPHGAKSIPQSWERNFEELRGLAMRIRESVDVPGATLDLCGNGMANSLLWAERTTAYFTPIGSSQHKVAWYGSARGVIYTTEKHMAASADIRTGAWEAEGSSQPQYIMGTIAHPGRRRHEYDFRNNLENVGFSVDMAVDALFAVLQDIGPKRLD